MNNQAAQKMPKCTCPDNGGCTKPCDRKACQPVPLTEELLIEAAILSGDTPQERRLQKVLTQAAAALSQNAGVTIECACPAGSGCTIPCRRGWRRILSEARALPPSTRDNVLDFIEREMLAAAAAASGGERVPLSERLYRGPAHDPSGRERGTEPQSTPEPMPPAGASVSERARALLAASYRESGDKAQALDVERRIPYVHHAIALRAVEQALTQQRGEPVASICLVTDRRLPHFAAAEIQLYEGCLRAISAALNTRHGAGDAEDAARYRWLRSHAVYGRMETDRSGFALNCDEPESEWDAAIDAARAGERG
jgi:hypothetical protein